MPRELITAVLGVCIPPIIVYQKKQLGMETIICLILWLFIPFAGVLYAFHVEGMDPVVNVLCLCISPLGYYMSRKQCDGDFWICFLLWLCIYPLAIMWAYHKA